MTDYDTWECPVCHRKVRMDRLGGLRAHTMVSGGQTACAGAGFNIFESSEPQLEARGITRRRRREVR